MGLLGRLLGAALAAPGLFSKSTAQGRGTGSITSISSGRLGRTRSSRINSPPWVIYNLAGDETSSRAGKRAAKSPWAWDSPGKERLGVRRMLVGMKFLPGENGTSHPVYLL